MEFDIEENPLQLLLPRYAEYSLSSWLDDVYTCIPPDSNFVSRFLGQAFCLSNVGRTGFTFMKLLVLSCKGILPEHYVGTVLLPDTFSIPTNRRTFLTFLQTYTLQVLSRKVREHTNPSIPLSLEQTLAVYQFWYVLEELAQCPLSEKMLISLLLSWWELPMITPVLTHKNGLGGFYRIPLAAALLRTNDVENVYLSILRVHRHDLGIAWSNAYPYEPFEPGNPEYYRAYCFSLLCPQQEKTYPLWKVLAQQGSFSELCKLLRQAEEAPIAILSTQTLPLAITV